MSLLGCLAITEGYIVAYLLPLIYRKKVTLSSQLRKVTKNKAAFPTPEAARKLLYLATERITRNWTSTIWEWAKILNQLAIRFEGRFEL